jgi:hypothetical protein
MKRIFRAAATLAVVAAFHPASASAGEITVTNIAMPSLETLTVGDPLSPPEGGYIGQQVLTTSTGATIDAWCIDLFHDASLGTQAPNFDYDIVPIATDNNPDYADGDPLSASQIDEIAYLVNYGNNLLADGGDGYGINQDSAAVQLAIWEVEYPTLEYWDYPSGPAPSSLVSQTGDLVEMADAAWAAGDVIGSAEEMLGVDGQQSYAIAVPASVYEDSPVPEPGSLALFSAVLTAFSLRRRGSSSAKPHIAAA